jgi:hypothetical protein
MTIAYIQRYFKTFETAIFARKAGAFERRLARPLWKRGDF